MGKGEMQVAVGNAKILTIGDKKYVCNISGDGKITNATELGKFSDWLCAMNSDACEEVVVSAGASYTVKKPTAQDVRALNALLADMFYAKDNWEGLTQNKIFREQD